MLQKPVVLLILAGVLAVVPTIAAAQTTSRFYAGVTFGSINISADDVDGTSRAGGAIVGFEALPWLDVEAEFSKPSDPFTRSYGGDVLSMAFGTAGASREELERAGIWLRYDKRRDINLTFSTVAIIRPSARGRVVPGVIIGMTNHNVQHRTDYTPVRIGPDVDPSNMFARPHSEAGTRNIGALTFGVNVAVMITRHFGVVPDLRYDFGSIGDVKENSLRPSVRVLWRF
jgi:hypothetical protein